MSNPYTNEPMMDMFIFETEQLTEQLEQIILSSEKGSSFSMAAINDIFRIMHTIKGSSAMMMFNNISTLSHSVEDVFFFLREKKPKKLDCEVLSDLVFESSDFIKTEMEKIKDKTESDGDASSLISSLKDFLQLLESENSECETELRNNEEKTEVTNSEESQNSDTTEQKQQYYISQEKSEKSSYKYYYKAIVFFQDDCEMENIRAYTIIRDLKELTDDIKHIPEDVINDESSVEVIRKEGFQIFIKSDLEFEKMHEYLMQTIFLKELILTEIKEDEIQTESFEEEHTEKNKQPLKLEEIVMPANEIKKPELKNEKKEQSNQAVHHGTSSSQSLITVSVNKLDLLMDLVGEMVISESMVIQNPDLAGLELDNFNKAARQLNKITSELQDIVMSIRMVPLSTTFQKMNRILRDMSKKLNKKVNLEIIGEETEVDKNIIEHISDPLMHLVRNSIDHGVEAKEERISVNKTEIGTLTLEAKNAGSDVLIIVRDDGRGLDKTKIYNKAKEKELVTKSENEMTEKEVFNLILAPGFSTKEKVSEFSGRGVGMDVVCQNIEKIGGNVIVDSVKGQGTAITLKIPLTLAIIDGMNVKVGDSSYTIPITGIKESFRKNSDEIITDPDGNELVMVRGNCYSAIRLHEVFGIEKAITDFSEGIFIMVEQDEKTICLFADELLGQQQVVVKTLPQYIQKFKTVKGLAGCTLLGDGSISLILDISELMKL